MLRGLLRNPLSVVGITILVVFFFMGVFAAWVAPPECVGQSFLDQLRSHPLATLIRIVDPCYNGQTFGGNPYAMPQRERVVPFHPPQGADVFQASPQPPSVNHPLGTTENHYSIWYGIVWGSRNAFRMGVIIVTITLLIGIVVGGIAGYKGGWTDEITMRVVEIFLVFPSLIAIFVLATILGRNVLNIVIAYIVFGWTGYTRYVRGQVLQVKENTYIEAAKAAGASTTRVLSKHVIPNAIYPVIVIASLDIGIIVLTVSGLSFLGLVPEGFADWGQLIGVSRNWILGTVFNPFEYWYTIVFAAASISLFVLSWNLLGDAVRDIADPRLRKQR